MDMQSVSVKTVTTRHRPARRLSGAEKAKLTRKREAEKAARDAFNGSKRGIIFERELVYPINYYGQ